MLDPALPARLPFRIHHRALTSTFADLHQNLTAKPALCSAWSEQVGVTLAERHSLAALMLKASLVFNPASVILFSSKSPQHMQANVAVAEGESLAEPARRLHALIQAHGAPASL